MQMHENHCIKRAGVAGLRARAEVNDLFCLISMNETSTVNLKKDY